MQDGEAYARLLNALAPEYGSTATLETNDPTERANLIIEQAEKLDCIKYVTPTDITEGSTNLNLAFVAQIFQHRSEILTCLIFLHISSGTILIMINYDSAQDCYKAL